MKKVRVHITKTTVNAPTYSNVTFEPTLINFFYGKNGTGKSTLARSFKDGNAALTWDGQPFPEERVLVYNEDFIRKNVQSYGNIPGVFTISEVNAQKKKEADEKAIEKKSVDDTIVARGKEAVAKQGELDKLHGDYVEAIWGATKEFRDKFPLALAYLRDKKKFADKIQSMTPKAAKIDPDAPSFDEEDMSMSAGENHSEEEPMIEIADIEALYQTIHGENQPNYSAYHLLSCFTVSIASANSSVSLHGQIRFRSSNCLISCNWWSSTCSPYLARRGTAMTFFPFFTAPIIAPVPPCVMTISAFPISTLNSSLSKKLL